ncbi:PAC2 family protein [Brachybacterium phenoliresistens]|uniref:Carboxylate--amine ligase n=1 Tax=Brachybacterium phenoliresistens TaxID=396014 RepID=Z9JWX9_9MICO|nr:PAC2 family protein [Brachybacterium phenoliresistens]EWS82689.1 carboxylate--amine ligase [Brachybacterium phenoliresistens]
MTRIAVTAFGGWNDAGEAATGVIEHLLSVWPSRRLALIDAEDYTDFQVSRPSIRTSEEGLREIEWPDTAVDLVTPQRGGELVLVHGPEPSLRWKSYCAEVLAQIDAAGATALVSLGALLADAPHTRPLPVSSRVEPGTHERAAEDAYEGPIGIPGVLGRLAVARGLRTTSLWVQVPHYVAQNPAPKAVLSLISELQSVVTAPIPLGDLEEDAAAWVRGVDELCRTDPEVADYVQRLERAQDATDLPEASGDAIAREFEQFLRRREEE